MSEFLPLWVIYIVYFLLFLLGVRVFKSVVIDPYVKFKETQYRANAKAAGIGGNNPFMKYNSLGELLTDAETGQIASMNDVRKQLEKDGLDPMKDAGFQKMMNTRDRLTQWKGRMTGNPFIAMIDQSGYPIVKTWIPEIQKAGKRFFKDFI